MVNGKRFTVLYAKRTLIPDESGIFKIAAITATLQKAKEFLLWKINLCGTIDLQHQKNTKSLLKN